MSEHGASDARPGLGVVADAVARERQVELQNFESLDSKAGIIFGAAAALVALSSDAWIPAVLVAIPLALTAGIFAFLAFAPRTVGNLAAGYVSKEYVHRPEHEVQEVLLTAQVRWCEQLHEINRIKAKRVARAMHALAMAVVAVLVGILQAPLWDAYRAFID